MVTVLLTSEQYFYRCFDTMLISSCDILRQLFKSRWKGITGREWDNSEEDGKYFSEGVGKKILKDAVKHQKLKIQSGNIELWDMTLLSFVLQNFGDPILYKEENEHVRTLKNLRNDQKHNSDNELTTEEYEVAVTDFIKVLEALKMKNDSADAKDFYSILLAKEYDLKMIFKLLHDTTNSEAAILLTKRNK
ncbi:unnamed protein product [Orchesella dallaii]|uniref:DZIP3-like HEPN domain-containing protein n=1 Tax=Orchesella dallaii TaxID=48710 RepID=A0ABP1RC44_9HEXA